MTVNSDSSSSSTSRKTASSRSRKSAEPNTTSGEKRETSKAASVQKEKQSSMTSETRPESKPIGLNQPEYYFNRELSWLEFNARVLHEALDERTPLLERLKFLAIFSNNLDEFFMVRVAGLKQQVLAGVSKRTADGRSPQQQLQDIRQRLQPMVEQQHAHFQRDLRQRLTQVGVYLLDYIDLDAAQRDYLQTYFQEQIFPALTPLAVDPSHPFPFISNLSLNLAVVVRDPETQTEYFARVKVPKVFPRFLKLSAPLGGRRTGAKSKGEVVWTGVPLEQVIAHNLESLFTGMDIQEYYPFRVTRHADLAVEEDEADDLLLAIEQELRKRRWGGSAVRVEVPSGLPDNVRAMLMRELEVEPDDIYDVDGILELDSLFALTSLPLPEHQDEPWSAVIPKRLQRFSDGFDASDNTNDADLFTEIRDRGDLLVHHPYHSFSATVQRFIEIAAHDPDVLAIKMTLYRTSGDSPVIRALVDAAENGKQVAVLVELKARFDEENNILWARKLEQAGVHVVYGLVGLKTHTKISMVVRREKNIMRRYVHIGTGNYNPKTAKLYTDLGLLSCREDLGADLTDLFNHLTGYSRQTDYRQLLVAPVNMRSRMLSLIRQEIDHCRNGQTGRIVAKMNSLVDSEIIATLYEASQTGVQIDLIIRGICCLRPGVPGVSENIKVVSVIGRFLEHSRIFYFHNLGDEKLFIGSADWMPRNLNRRVEAITPILDPDLGKDLQEILGIMLSDNRQAWELQTDGSYIQRQPPAADAEQSSQKTLMDLAQH
jgi:polyphosphate kinase